MKVKKINSMQQIRVMNKLASSATSKSLVLFCGAGVSKAIDSTMISWAELLRLLNEKEGIFLDEVLEKELASTPFPIIAETIINSDKSDYENIFKDNFIKGKLNEDLKIINDINELECKYIITTNYDDLLESNLDGYEALSYGSNKETIKQHDKKTILKIHGCASEVKNVVLTQSDYFKFINKKSYYSNLTENLFISNQVVFIGYSLSDFNILNIIDNLKKTYDKKSTQNNLTFVLQKYDYIDGELRQPVMYKYFEQLKINIIVVEEIKDFIEELVDKKRQCENNILLKDSGCEDKVEFKSIFESLKRNEKPDKVDCLSLISDNIYNFEAALAINEIEFNHTFGNLLDQLIESEVDVLTIKKHIYSNFYHFKAMWCDFQQTKANCKSVLEILKSLDYDNLDDEDKFFINNIKQYAKPWGIYTRGVSQYFNCELRSIEVNFKGVEKEKYSNIVMLEN